MRKLNESVLLIGDIILTTTNALLSKGIRASTKSDISHAMIYVASHSVIDSTGDGVHSRNTQRLFYDDNCMIHVMRLKQPLPKERMQLVIDYARSCIGTQYSVIGAARSLTGPKTGKSKKQFCSRLVARAYSYGTVDLVSKVDYCRPDQLLRSPLLRRIKNAVRSVSQEEMNAMESRPSTPKGTMEATNNLLAGARKLDRSIQTLSDLDMYLVNNPQKDAAIAKLYVESGYLTLWYFEKCKNEWQYDLGLLEIVPIEEGEKRSYCSWLVENFEEEIRRFEVNKAAYMVYFKEYRLQTFYLLLELYDKLVDLHVNRLQIAMEWLQRHGNEKTEG